jgi:uncharacterized protein (TIGR00730 family)
MENHGKVWGVIPKSILEKEVGNHDITELFVVDSMHERKEKMYQMSDAFLALPGGFGTLDELCEILTWSQLGYHQKPVYILNYLGIFDNLIKHFSHIMEEGFLSEEHYQLMQLVEDSEELIQTLLKV